MYLCDVSDACMYALYVCVVYVMCVMYVRVKVWYVCNIRKQVKFICNGCYVCVYVCC